MQSDKKVRSDKRRIRIRKRVAGAASRPRLAVKFSGKHIYAQCINDESGETLVFLSTLEREIRKQKLVANIAGAASLGKLFGEKATSAGIKCVVFDRSGRRYHGGVKAFADAAREAGLSF
ncbi:MAG: 50S ribosomal protein L18 [Puniceicoccales bacterium]|jgi:large subunit ribosomal protein L18|nr:50S ribosomal protein L18 [Puniceicoccales bacterium]